MTTLNDLVVDLKTLNPDLPLVFETDEGEIGGGYHVTELKHAQIHSIDCGGNLSDWIETNLQLLDGNDQTHMAVGRFLKIAALSMGKIDGLGTGQLSFEYGPKNIGLRRFYAAEIVPKSKKITIKLQEDIAKCKPNLAATLTDISSKEIVGTDQTASCC